MESRGKSNDPMPFSNHFKRKMNRLFREEAGIENIPHPEVDNIWECMRSRIRCMRKNKKKGDNKEDEDHHL